MSCVVFSHHKPRCRTAKKGNELAPSHELPSDRSMMPAVSRASPALQRAKTMELTRFRSPRRLATTVATIVPATTPHRAFGPRAISVPARAGHAVGREQGKTSSWPRAYRRIRPRPRGRASSPTPIPGQLRRGFGLALADCACRYLGRIVPIATRAVSRVVPSRKSRLPGSTP